MAIRNKFIKAINFFLRKTLLYIRKIGKRGNSARFFLAACTLHSSLLVVLTYWWMNQPIELPDENLIALINQRIKVWKQDSQKTEDLHKRFLFINCSYDKALVPYADEYGEGQIAITDRKKIADFLHEINNVSQQPKAIAIDLQLENPSENDSLLYQEMNQAKNLLLSWNRKTNNIEVPSNVKKAEASYVTRSGSFLKYSLLNDAGEYLPTAIYTTLTGDTPKLNSLGAVTLNQKLSLNTFIVDILIRVSDLNYFNLNEFISLPPTEIEERVKNKVIIIGEYFQDDIHDTVLGKQPGPLLVANTFLAIEKGQSVIKWSTSLLLFIFYFLLTWRLLLLAKDKGLKLNKLIHSRILRVSFRFLTYIFVFAMLSICFYQIFDQHFQLILFAVYFNVIEFLTRRYTRVRMVLAKLLPTTDQSRL